MVISSGMQSMNTMRQVYQIVKPLNPNFCFLQCTSAYPLQPEDVNLRVIPVSEQERVPWAQYRRRAVQFYCVWFPGLMHAQGCF